MADLVTPAQVIAYLGLEDPDPVALDLADRVEAAFEAACNRANRPFLAAQPTRTEVHEAPRSPKLWLDYPVASLTSITLSPYTVSIADEVVDVTPSAKLVTIDRDNPHIIVRRDGRFFGSWPGYVTVVYNAAADLPADAAQAVLDEVARLYNGLGVEGAMGETIGGYHIDFSTAAAGDKASGWLAAVAAHRLLVFA